MPIAISNFAKLASTAGIAAGWIADQLLGDPRRGHPVAGFGRIASAFEKRCYGDSRTAGAGYVACLIGGVAALGIITSRLTRDHPYLRFFTTAAATWTVLGGRSLALEAEIIHHQLTADDLAAARRQIRHLVGRDPSQLNVDEIARACVESVAENSSDAVVAPLFWGAVAGVPGLLTYRAINTLDAMVGHKSPRYLNFGWAAARLDDVANWLPARVAGMITTAAAPAVGGRIRDATHSMITDAHRHPSPNAGVVEAAFAGALDVRLGGVNVYHGQAENRGTLGSGRPVGISDLPRARRLGQLISAGAMLGAVAVRGHFAWHRKSRRVTP